MLVKMIKKNKVTNKQSLYTLTLADYKAGVSGNDIWEFGNRNGNG